LFCAHLIYQFALMGSG